MKNLLIPALLIVSITAFAQNVKKKVVYRHFKTFYVDINNDSKPDTIVLSSSLQEPTYFNRISISMSGAKKTVFKAKDHWEEIDHWFLDSNKNMVKSKNIFIKKTPKHAVIIISAGTDAAGYGGEFSIINIEDNNIKMVFDHGFGDEDKSVDVDIEIPCKLIDLENNDRLCFIYCDYGELYKSVEGGNIGTYHPYFVYPITNEYRYNEALSKSYNEKHYVYVDSTHKGKIEIFYPNNPKLKPRIWKKK